MPSWRSGHRTSPAFPAAPEQKETPVSSITGIRIRHYGLTLRQPWRDAHGTVSGRAGLLIELETDNGIGVGDCAPLPAHGTETLEEAVDFLRQVGNDFGGGAPQGLLAKLGKSRKRRPAACFAIETACLDLISRKVGKMLGDYIGPGAPDTLSVNTMIGTLDDDVIARARTAAIEGFSILKVKVGLADISEELERLRALADDLPENTELRLDAGGAWSPAQAAEVLDGLVGLPIEGLEEPCKDADMETLAGLQARVPFPLALDESLYWRGVQTVIDARPVRRVVLKPMALGSLGLLAKLGRQARRAGLQVIVTSALDSVVGVTAAAHAAAALEAGCPPHDRQTHGLATSTWVQDDVASPPEIDGGKFHLPQSLGLGVTVPRLS